MITLEINADDVEFIENIGIGTIDMVICNNFEANSGDGVASVLVSNIGNIPASFTLSLNCTIDI